MRAQIWYHAITQQRFALAILGFLGHAVWATGVAFAFVSAFGSSKTETGWWPSADIV